MEKLPSTFEERKRALLIDDEGKPIRDLMGEDVVHNYLLIHKVDWDYF